MATCPNHCRRTTFRVRVVGVDDGAFHTGGVGEHHAPLLAVLFQDSQISSVKMGRIEVDGRDANRVVRSLLRSMRFDAVMLSGISFGGFNLINIDKLAHDTRKPVIALTGDKPDNKAVRTALRDHFDDWRERWQMVLAAGRVYSCKPLKDEPKLYFEVKGASPAFAREVVRATAVISRLPEPIRVASILARGLSSLIEARSP